MSRLPTTDCYNYHRQWGAFAFLRRSVVLLAGVASSSSEPVGSSAPTEPVHLATFGTHDVFHKIQDVIDSSFPPAFASHIRWDGRVLASGSVEELDHLSKGEGGDSAESPRTVPHGLAEAQFEAILTEMRGVEGHSELAACVELVRERVLSTTALLAGPRESGVYDGSVTAEGADDSDVQRLLARMRQLVLEGHNSTFSCASVLSALSLGSSPAPPTTRRHRLDASRTLWWRRKIPFFRSLLEEYGGKHIYLRPAYWAKAIVIKESLLRFVPYGEYLLMTDPTKHIEGWEELEQWERADQVEPQHARAPPSEAPGRAQQEPERSVQGTLQAQSPTEPNKDLVFNDLGPAEVQTLRKLAEQNAPIMIPGARLPASVHWEYGNHRFRSIHRRMMEDGIFRTAARRLWVWLQDELPESQQGIVGERLLGLRQSLGRQTGVVGYVPGISF